MESKIRHQAGNQNSTTYASSTRCVIDSLHHVISWSACDSSAPIISLFAHDEPLCIHHEWGWVLSVWKEKKRKEAHSGRPLTQWLSSNVRWRSTSWSGWNMLGRTALKDFTFWSSSSLRDSVTCGKNNTDFWAAALCQSSSPRHRNYDVMTSNQLNPPFICVITSSWCNHKKCALCEGDKLDLKAFLTIF